MKVLLLFPQADGQTGLAIFNAFKNLDHEIQTVDAKLNPEYSFSTAKACKPDLVFCSRTHQLIDEIRKIKERFKNTTICMWNVDSRVNIESWKHLYSLIKLVDFHFVIETTTIPQWKELNPNTFFLPQGVQNEVYKKPEYTTRKDIEKYVCDVSFAGKNRPYRHSFMRVVTSMDVTFKKWGLSRKSKIYNEEHNKMVSLSKINLGCSANSELDNYVSVRDYKIMGAGGFLLEKQRNTEKLFPLDIMDFYDSVNELEDKIHYWLTHDEERKAVAERGYDWVHKNSTYTHRIKKALEIMGL